MTPQYVKCYSQLRTPPYLEIQSYRILNYHVTQLVNYDMRGVRGQGRKSLKQKILQKHKIQEN